MNDVHVITFEKKMDPVSNNNGILKVFLSDFLFVSGLSMHLGKRNEETSNRTILRKGVYNFVGW